MLVRSHGPFTWGPDAPTAVENALVLEEVARMGLMTEALAPQGLPLGEELRDRHFLRKHGAGAYYGQPRSPRS